DRHEHHDTRSRNVTFPDGVLPRPRRRRMARRQRRNTLTHTTRRTTMATPYLDDLDREPVLTSRRTRIQITSGPNRWSRKKHAVSDAVDFWSFAGAAANVIMQLGWPEV